MSKNLFYKSSATIIKAFCGTVGLYFVIDANNGSQSTLVIPVTSEMKGKTLRMSCDAGDDVANRWICGQVNQIPTSGRQTYGTDNVLFVAGDQLSDHERFYSDTVRIVGNYNYIVFFFSGGLSDLTKFVNSLMICDDETYYPYREGISPEHEVKSVIGSALQSFNDNEKERARNNIGIPKYVKLATYDTSIAAPADAARITDVGDFHILYYHDNGGNLRLLAENMDMGDSHSLTVSCGESVDAYGTISFGSRADLSAINFSSSNGRHQDLRFIIDGVNFGELSIQWIQSATPGASQLWYKG